MIDRRLIAASLLLCLTACGQAGPLVLPDEADEVVPTPTPAPKPDSDSNPELQDVQTAPVDR
jgi:predicted small lipoprotein YifL